MLFGIKLINFLQIDVFPAPTYPSIPITSFYLLNVNKHTVFYILLHKIFLRKNYKYLFSLFRLQSCILLSYIIFLIKF